MTREGDNFRVFLLAALVILSIIVAQLVAIMVLNGGQFTYTLDDSYIHLALSERLAEGHYGLNPGKVGAPSSSILWPFLLVPLSGTAFHDWVPLLYNLLAALGSIYLLSQIVCLCWPRQGLRDRRLRVVSVVLLALLLNLCGLVFVGMEHSLQVFLALAVLWGMLRYTEEQVVPRFVIFALILSPLVRYESLAVCLAAIIYLYWRRPWRGMLVVVAVLALPAAFSAFLHAESVGLLPASVQLKIGIGDGSVLTKISLVVKFLLKERYGLVSMLLGALLVERFVRKKSLGPQMSLAAPLLLVLVLHVVFGQWGWCHRYEIYMLAVVLPGLAYLYRASFYRTLQAGRVTVVAGAGVAALCIFFPLYLTIGVLMTPYYSHCVYSQQFQLHRLAARLDEPVAVNDLGWVAFRDRNPVLDLWGLGSHEVLRLRRSKVRQRLWLDRICKENDVHLVMIYDHWFPDKPPSWIRLARMQLALPSKGPLAGNEVTFYATSAGEVERLTAELRAFGSTLPPSSRITFIEQGEVE